MRLYLLWGLLPFLLLHSAGFAQESRRWIEIATNDRNETILYDTSFLVRNGNLVTVRIIEKLNTPEEDGSTQAVDFYLVDCDHKVGTITKVVKFNKDAQITSYELNDHPEQLVQGTKNSLFTKITQYACVQR
jgi:hypothetical protein